MTPCIASNTGNWLMYFGDKKINPKWNLHHEIQYRSFNFLGNTDQLLIRTGLGYNLSEQNNNVLIGYCYVYNEQYLNNSERKTYFSEHRIYQQFITRQFFNRLLIQHRYRIEERFFKTDFRLRFRYSVSLNVALNNKEMMAKTFYIALSNEIFINSKQTYFDRNRLYGGLGYRFNKNLRTELGLLNQSTNSISKNQLNIISYLNF
jgi:hypothetical protein